MLICPCRTLVPRWCPAAVPRRPILRTPPCPSAELASSKLQQDQLQREVKQQQALAAEKDARLADAAAQEQRLRQQADQLREQLQQSGAATQPSCF